jgi:hypothetical protein
MPSKTGKKRIGAARKPAKTAKKAKKVRKAARKPAPSRASIGRRLDVLERHVANLRRATSVSGLVSGVLRLVDRLQHAFLDTDNGSYLLLLDPEETNVYVEADAVAAYSRFRSNPGNGNALTCRGYVVTSGDTKTFHVVN